MYETSWNEMNEMIRQDIKETSRWKYDKMISEKRANQSKHHWKYQSKSDRPLFRPTGLKCFEYPSKSFIFQFWEIRNSGDNFFVQILDVKALENINKRWQAASYQHSVRRFRLSLRPLGHEILGRGSENKIKLLKPQKKLHRFQVLLKGIYQE